jgi:hypothetical protein
MLLVNAGGLLYFNYWMRFVFSNIEFLFFSDLSEAKYSVDELYLGPSHCWVTFNIWGIYQREI